MAAYLDRRISQKGSFYVRNVPGLLTFIMLLLD